MRLRAPAHCPETLGILLRPQFAMVALFSAIEPLRIANRMAGQELFRWWLISEDGEPVIASNGMHLSVDRALITAPACHNLAVCTSFAPEDNLSPALIQWLVERAATDTVLGGVDTGSFVLARAGLLAGQTVTLHWESLPEFRRRYPSIEAVESLYEVNPEGFSCAGGSSAIDMALACIRRRQGNALAGRVGAQLMHRKERLPASRQRDDRNTGTVDQPKVLQTILHLMVEHRETPLPVKDLASRVHMSWRGLERLFERHFQCSPQVYYQQLRLSHGHHLLLETRQPVLDVALACGFTSSSTFTRAFRRLFGLTPRALRQQRDAWLSP